MLKLIAWLALLYLGYQGWRALRARGAQRDQDRRRMSWIDRTQVQDADFTEVTEADDDAPGSRR